MTKDNWFYKPITEFTMEDALQASEAGYECIWKDGKVKQIKAIKRKGIKDERR